MKKEFVERVKVAISPIKPRLDEAQKIVFSNDGLADWNGVELLELPR
jgi:hypothetical protein